MNILNYFSSIKKQLKFDVVTPLRWVSFILLAYVSFNLSLDLFKGFGTGNDVELFVRLVIGLELSKGISIVMSKTNFYYVTLSNLKETYKYLLAGLGFGFLYLILAIVSVFSSYGYVRTSIEYTASVSSVSSNKTAITFHENKMEEYQAKITGYTTQLSRDDLSLNSKERIEKLMSEADTKLLYHFDEKAKLEEASISAGKTSSSMYGLIAQDVNKDESFVRFWIQIMTVFVIEVCMTAMAPGLHGAKKTTVTEPEPLPPIPPVKPKRKYQRRAKVEEPKKKRKYTKKSEYEKMFGDIEVYPAEARIMDDVQPVTAIEVPKQEEAMQTEEVPVETVVEPVMEEKIPVRKTMFERFLDALFNNGSNTYLKTKAVAAVEANVPLSRANEFFTSLASTKFNNYSLIEYRKDSLWYPNFTKEVILDLFSSGKISSTTQEEQGSVSKT